MCPLSVNYIGYAMIYLTVARFVKKKLVIDPTHPPAQHEESAQGAF